MKNRILVTALVAGMVSMLAVAADPPAAQDPEEITDPAVALAKAKELEPLVAKGDAEATFDFAMLLATFGPFSPMEDKEHAAEWRKLRGRQPISELIYQAAEGGSLKAIEAVCRMRDDPYAPGPMRDHGKERCDALRAKYPAQ